MFAGFPSAPLLIHNQSPSPYSARQGFFGHGHFRKANNWLARRFGEHNTIDWASVMEREVPVVERELPAGLHTFDQVRDAEGLVKAEL